MLIALKDHRYTLACMPLGGTLLDSDQNLPCIGMILSAIMGFPLYSSCTMGLLTYYWVDDPSRPGRIIR